MFNWLKKLCSHTNNAGSNDKDMLAIKTIDEVIGMILLHQSFKATVDFQTYRQLRERLYKTQPPHCNNLLSPVHYSWIYYDCTTDQITGTLRHLYPDVVFDEIKIVPDYVWPRTKGEV